VGAILVTNQNQISSLKYVFADASLGSEANSGGENFGGLVGMISGKQSSISFSSAKVSLHARNGSKVGGIAGKVYGATILKSSSRGSIEGSDDVGGLVGELKSFVADYVPYGQVEKSYSLASVQANEDKNTFTVSQANAGGLIGATSGITTLSGSFHAQGSVVTKNILLNPNLALVGFDYQLNCIDSLATHSPGAFTFISSNCSSSTVAQSMMASTYNNLEFGLVEVAASPTGGDFFMSTFDNNYDYPRLAWEVTLQEDTGLSVAFLERPCSGKLTQAGPDGSGSEADPYQVCTLSQLAASGWSSDSNYYKLMRDIDFHFTGPLLGDAGVLSAKFDANKNTFHNVFINSSSSSDGFRGLWDRLTSTAELKNLDVSEYQLNVPLSTNAPTGDLFVGAIARVNEGNISHVRAWDTRLDIMSWNFAAASEYSLHLGGLVGKNTGTITKSEIDPDIQFFHPYFNGTNCADNDLGDYDKLRLGGIAGLNSGTITKSNTRLWLNWYSNDVSCNFSMNEASDEVMVGGVVGENVSVNSSAALISETEVKIEVNIQNSPAASPGNMFFGGIAGKNGGTIQDTLVGIDQANFSLNTLASSDNFAGGIAGLNSATGKVKRSVSQSGSLSSSNFDGIGGIIGKNLNSNTTGTDISSNLCLSNLASLNKEVYGVLSTSSCLNSPITYVDSVAGPSGTLTLNTEILTGLNFTVDPTDRTSGAVWYFDLNSHELRLRSTEGWFDGI
jgi:hypothetical protein